jgi:hypothetical protein
MGESPPTIFPAMADARYPIEQHTTVPPKNCFLVAFPRGNAKILKRNTRVRISRREPA